MTDSNPENDPYYLNAMISLQSRDERADAITKYLRREGSKQGVAAAVLFFQHLAADAEKWESDARTNKLVGRVPFNLSVYYRQFADLLIHAGSINREDLERVIYGHQSNDHYECVRCGRSMGRVTTQDYCGSCPPFTESMDVQQAARAARNADRRKR